MKTWICVTCVIFALAAVAAPLSAQSGSITGTVTDTTGAVVPAATVEITNVASQTTRTVATTGSGNYSVSFLDPGEYTISVSHPGFQSQRSNVVLQVGDTLDVDFQLQVGEVTEYVEVTGGVPLLETVNTDVGTVIENKRIVDLPLNGRNYLQLVQLTPHVNAEMGTGGQASGRQGGERAEQPIAVAGQRLEFNHFTLDGVENTDPNFNTFVIRPSIEALQEFEVQSGVYSAQYGRQPAQITVTTKAGGNAFHGSVFEFFRNDSLDAKEWKQAGAKNPFVRNQFGFVLSGPLVRNRLFFMSNFEVLRDRKSLRRVANVAPLAFRQGDFSRLIAADVPEADRRPIFDPQTRVFNDEGIAIAADQFPNNIIPASRLNPISQQLLEFLPEPNQPGEGLFGFRTNFQRSAGRPLSTETFSQRIDYNMTNNSQWFGRFSWGDEFAGDALTFAEQSGRTETRPYQIALSNTTTISPTVINEARFGWTKFVNDRLLRFANERNVTAELGIPGLNPPPLPEAYGTPSIGLADGLTGFGESSGGPFLNDNDQFQWSNNMTVIRGNHTFQFGAELRRERFNQIGNQFARGSFIFQQQATEDPANRGVTGFSFSSFMIGESRRSERAFGLANTQFRRWSASAYIEDKWKMTPKLTVTLGLRYEITPPFHDRNRGIMNLQKFDPGFNENGIDPNTRTPIFTRPGHGDFHENLAFRFFDDIPTQVGNDALGRALVNTDKDDFAPRAGIAYQLTPKTTIRAGGGFFFAQDSGNPRFDMGRNLAGRGRFESDDEMPNSNLLDPFAFERAAFQCTGFDGPCQGPPFVLTNDEIRETPTVINWMFSVQRELRRNMVLDVTYQGNTGHNLERLRAFNQAVKRTGPDDARDIFERRPWPVFGIVQTVDDVVASNYHSLGAKLTQRLTNGVTFLTAYTWSHAIDNGSGIRTRSGDRLFPENSNNLQKEKGPSQFDQRQRFVASILYQIPGFRNGQGIAGKLLSGWEIGSIVTFSDGTPLNVGGIGDRNNTGQGAFPDATGISPFPDDQTPDNFFNINAFDQSNPELRFRDGTVGRNVLISPGLNNWDFSVLKRTPVGIEGHEIQFRFEAFNFLNRPNLNSPPVDVRAPTTFGVIQTAREQRRLQFALKYLF